MEFRKSSKEGPNDMKAEYCSEYRTSITNLFVKVRTSKALHVTGIFVFGCALFMSSQNITSSAAAKTSDWGVTAGVATEIQRSKGVININATQLAGISNSDAITTTATEGSQLAANVETASAPDNVSQQITGYTNLGVANVNNYLNIRESASEDGTLCGKLPQNAGCEILEDAGGWYKIQSGNVTGYVKSEYLLTGDAAWQKADEVKTMTATVSTETLYVREEMNTDCKVVALVSGEEELEVLEKQDAWAKVKVDNDEGYISLDYATISYQIPKAVAMTELKESDGVSKTRVSIVEYAKQFLGNPYVWGGSSLTKGADCSGFTMSIYAHYGVSLPHSSAAQSHMGKKVSASEAKPGDLFFYGKGNGVNHVAMYIGNGQVIHASTERTGIKISNAFYRTPITIRRFLD